MPVIETSDTPTFPSGVYRHRASGQELVAQETGKFGNPQAAAFVRMGFEYVGPVSEKVADELPKASDPFSQGPEHNVVNPDESAAVLAARAEAAKAAEADAARNASTSASLAAKKDTKETK